MKPMSTIDRLRNGLDRYAAEHGDGDYLTTMFASDVAGLLEIAEAAREVAYTAIEPGCPGCPDNPTWGHKGCGFPELRAALERMSGAP